MGAKDVFKKIGGVFAKGGRIAAAFDPTGTASRVVGALEGAGIISSPEAKAAAQEILLNHELKMVEHHTAQVEAINKTMRAELQSGTAWQRGWRPMLGWTLGLLVVNNYILLPYFAAWGLKPVEIPLYVWNTLTVAVGIAAGTRGWEKIKRAMNGAGKD